MPTATFPKNFNGLFFRLMLEMCGGLAAPAACKNMYY